ncbi:oxidoreductase [Massilia sp. CCM 8733]|uniref:Oxidoreductase n=1 Tax=Massilia mucilaginosa TaxID=2609282 RepID=A0ABX0NML3_9BURK|nr:oxidoreductase [Massilia mucilaginosa]NHZ88049.1 oxidoreductase [Massilia mucilaginosa]
MEPTREVRVGLIGYGFSGATFQAPLIASTPGMRITRVCSSQGERVLRDFPGAVVVPDPAGLIDSSEVDLVVVATANASHAPLAKQALLAGKHVVVEKPFTITLDDGAELIALADERQLVLSVFHNRRWDSDFLTLRQTIEAGLLGPINTYEAHFDRYRPHVRGRWREQDLPGSGLLYDLGAHLIDQALVLFGNPDCVNCDMGVQRGGAPSTASDDYFHLTMRYGARRVILHAASLVLQAGPRFIVHGESGSFIKHGMDPQEAALIRGERPGAPEWGVEAEAQHAQISFVKGGLTVTGKAASLPGSYQEYYQRVFDAIVNGKSAPVTAREGLAVIKIIRLAMQSHAQQRSVTFE